MSRRYCTAVLSVLMVCGLLAAAPAAPAASKPFDIVTKDYIVPTRHGKIYVEVAHPARNGEIVEAPAIFTYSPYSLLGAPPHFRRSSGVSRWVPQGYARVWADVVGTGNSGGCYDYGGKREKQTGYDLVEWIGTRKWSTGKVAMIGGSYEGTTATAAAVTDPPHLTTIVPEAAISRWYEYAYSGGIRYSGNNENPTDEGFDTPFAFDFGLAVPPPLDVTNPSWGDRVEDAVTPCEEVEHTEHGYDTTPDYDRFWRERDYIRKADNVDIPVLVAHNWGDWNVKQEEAINLYRALDNSPNRKLYMGTRWAGHGTPGGKDSPYYNTVEAWMDHYLMGADNGIQNMPKIHSMRSDYTGPLTEYAGGWPDTSAVKLWGQRVDTGGYQWRLLPSRPPRPGGDRAARYLSTGTNAELDANTAPHANTEWVFYQSPVLERDVRIFGKIEVQIYSTIDREWITYTPTIIDYDPTIGTAAMSPYGPVSVTRGWLDSRYRKSLAERVPVEPGKRFSMKVVEKPQDYTFKKGHRIGLTVQTEIIEWNVPKPPPCTTPCPEVRTHWQIGNTNVTLPVVNAPSNLRRLFEPEPAG